MRANQKQRAKSKLVAAIMSPGQRIAITLSPPDDESRSADPIFPSAPSGTGFAVTSAGIAAVSIIPPTEHPWLIPVRHGDAQPVFVSSSNLFDTEAEAKERRASMIQNHIASPATMNDEGKPITTFDSYSTRIDVPEKAPTNLTGIARDAVLAAHVPAPETRPECPHQWSDNPKHDPATCSYCACTTHRATPLQTGKI